MRIYWDTYWEPLVTRLHMLSSVSVSFYSHVKVKHRALEGGRHGRIVKIRGTREHTK